MELELTHRSLKIEKFTTKREVEVGDEIHYFGQIKEQKWINTLIMIDDPDVGTVEEDAYGLYIKWDDGTSNLRLDNSEHTKSVLENCGFA